MRKQFGWDKWTVVDLDDPEAMRVLAEELDCSLEELRSAVARVGPLVADVRNYVSRSRAFTAHWDAARPHQRK